MDEQTDQFDALGSDGEAYTVVKYQTVLRNRNHGGFMRPHGFTRYALVDGSRVERIDNGAFRVAGTELMLRKIL
ncbi:hypothetical protein [Methylobacterium durans]|uniref:Uncharacterized protein n=1 Tax=Methylobacterium durans TaxID=2202825 RepID=A0A2U8WDA6_9HYPH|nr:hypothetical protein [Methylobacterium durans]AWN43296.1 hypothetical protein DK389_25825 [Methylobacterium durans]